MNRVSRAAEALGIRLPKNIRPKIAKLMAIVLALSGLIIPTIASAATLNTASVSLSDPTPTASGVSYNFVAQGVTTGTAIKCIQFLFTTTSGGTSLPSSMGITSTSLDSSSNFVPTPAGFGSPTNPNAYTVQFTDSSGETPASHATWNLQLDGITNGSVANTNYYETVQTFSDTGCSTPIDNATVEFIYNAGAQLSLTVNDTLSFSVNGVAPSTSCDGGTTGSATVTGTSLPFGTVTAGTPELLCQAVTAATNSTNGFTVYLRDNQAPTNALGQTIAYTSGTNAAPATFGNSANSQGVYGYTTNDTALGTGTANRFTSPAQEWAAPTTTNEEVAYSGTGTTSVTYDVGHQVETTLTTEPGTYTNTIIYTCTPVY